jgi:hypothetical protein
MLVFAVALFISATAANAITPHLNTWTLVRVADSSALCLDGSPAAFYIRPGSNGHAAKWIVHLEGGGWATDLGGHFARSQVKLFFRSAAFPLSQLIHSFSNSPADCIRQQFELHLHRLLRQLRYSQLGRVAQSRLLRLDRRVHQVRGCSARRHRISIYTNSCTRQVLRQQQL